MAKARAQAACRRMARVMVAAAVVALCLAIAADAATQASAETPVVAPATLGLFLDSTGSDAAAAAEIRNGAELTVAQCAAGASACRLVAAAGTGQWTAGAGGLVGLVFNDGIRAILGPADGRSAHLAEQVAARAKGRLVLLTPWVSDSTVTRVGVPWFFRLVPDDLQQAGALVEVMHGESGGRGVAVLAAQSGYDARKAREAFEKVMRAARGSAPVEIPVAEAPDLRALVAAVQASQAGALLLLLPPDLAATAVRGLREAGNSAVFFGPLRLASRSFLDAAGDAAEGMVLAAPPESASAAAGVFRDRYRSTYGSEASAAAAYGYDGAAVLLEALRQPGVAAKPELLRDAVAAVAREGVTGTISFDEFGNRVGPAPLARVQAGRLRPLDPSSRR